MHFRRSWIIAAVVVTTLISYGCAGTTGEEGGTPSGGDGNASGTTSDAQVSTDGGSADTNLGQDTNTAGGGTTADSTASSSDTSGSGGTSDVGGATDGGTVSVDAGGAQDAGPAPADTTSTPKDAGATDSSGGVVTSCCSGGQKCAAGSVCFDGPFKARKCMNVTFLSKGQCWTDAQCDQGTYCDGASACGCDAKCKAMDKPGICKKKNVVTTECAINVKGQSKGCKDFEYCKLSSKGICSGKGQCAPRPKICTKVLNEQCACDGKTYGNTCLAATAGLNVKSKGKCPTSVLCGGKNCDDGNGCTKDACIKGSCVYTPASTSSKCDDGNACTVGDMCSKDSKGGAVCKPGKLTVCKPTNSCQKAACDSKTGKCIFKTDPNCVVGKKCSIKAGLVSTPCGKSSYCKLISGCSGSGYCTNKPTICNKMLAPVCGCNKQTYSNSCLAASAGRNVESTGKCSNVSQPGCCKVDGDCKVGVCVGGATGKGVCKDTSKLLKTQCWSDAQCGGGTCKSPNVCPCGAKCFAPDKPGICGGGGTGACKVGDNTACAKDEYCSGPCGGLGKCDKKPGMCASIYKPVCGCDKQTYSNSCTANAKGVSVASDGKCGGASGSCKVGDTKACGVSQFCKGPCGGKGSCSAKPKVCNKLLKPVCGCDKKTYSNQCVAESAGMAVASSGACQP